jgi:hypothetical protein
MITLHGSFINKVLAMSCEDPKVHMIVGGGIGPVIICANSANPAAAIAKNELGKEATSFAQDFCQGFDDTCPTLRFCNLQNRGFTVEGCVRGTLANDMACQLQFKSKNIKAFSRNGKVIFVKCKCTGKAAITTPPPTAGPLIIEPDM